MLFRKSRATRKMMLHLMHHELGQAMTGPEAEAMIRQGVMVNALLPNRDTLLSLACIWGNRDVVRALLHYGADVNGYKYGGSVPLHIAAMNGHAEVVRLLASSGADLNKRDAYGGTALHKAMTDKGREVRTPQLLVALGVDPTMLDGQGRLATDLLADYIDANRRYPPHLGEDERAKALRITALEEELAALKLLTARA